MKELRFLVDGEELTAHKYYGIADLMSTKITSLIDIEPDEIKPGIMLRESKEDQDIQVLIDPRGEAFRLSNDIHADIKKLAKIKEINIEAADLANEQGNKSEFAKLVKAIAIGEKNIEALLNKYKIMELFKRIGTIDGVEKITESTRCGFKTESEIQVEHVQDIDCFIAGATLILDALENNYIKRR